MPLTAARFADMQTRSENYLLDTAVIEARTETPDGAGGWSDSWTARGTVPFYLQVDSIDKVNEQSGRLESYTEYTGYIAADGTVAPGDKVTHNSKIYYAQGVVEAKTRRAYLAFKLVLESTSG